jgi:organic hydroperoxide reductase OsmC/OhrA
VEALHSFALTLTRGDGYAYTVEFDDASLGRIQLDELPPLGEGRGPDPKRMLAAAVGSCLAASLQHCLTKAHAEAEGMTARVEGSLFRNRDGHLRIDELRVVLEPSLAEASRPRFGRCLDLFEDFCTVTESVRKGIDVLVEVRPRYAGSEAAVLDEPAETAA